MDKLAKIFSDEPPARQSAAMTFPPPRDAGIGWGIFIAQVVTVLVVYLIFSMVPIIPALIGQALDGGSGELQLTSGLALASVMVSVAMALLVAWLWLRREGRVAEAWNFVPPLAGWSRTLLWAAGVTVAIFAIFTIGGILVERLGLGAPDATALLNFVTESPLMFGLWVFGVAVLAAGTGEELLYRGFLMDRLARLSGLRGKIWLILIIQAVLFGLPHAYQGAGGMVITGSVGLLLGWIRLKKGGNLWVCVIAHIAVDVIAMSAAYGEKLGWFGAA